MSNDLGFLIIFIILPTVLIVSGFWLILIVRSELRLRFAPEASTSAEDPEDEPAVARDADSKRDAAPGERTLDLPVRPVVAKLASVPATSPASGVDRDDDEEFWTPAPAVDSPVEPAAQAAADEPPDRSADESARGDTGNLPEEWEVDIGGESETTDGDPEAAGSRAPRTPTARMVPSTEHVRKRTGQAPRRVPPIGRSSLRNEDAVESPDRG